MWVRPITVSTPHLLSSAPQLYLSPTRKYVEEGRERGGMKTIGIAYLLHCPPI
uniref:Uncharacterized protein n=1 Tax=Anguilla anguilla TaxID=7936 RepID=A0A0E9VPS7_ANGAN